MRKSVRAGGFAISTILAAALAGPVQAQAVDQTNRIIDEGMNRSEVMVLAHELMDGIGARLSNSPQMRRAEQWAVDRLNGWNLTNVHREGFEFGRGWEILSSSAQMVSPRPRALTVIPVTWTPPTDGTVRAEIVMAPMSEPEHFEAYRGQLAGKIVLISLPGEGSEPDTAPFLRFTDAEIAERNSYHQPDFDPGAIDDVTRRDEFTRLADAFLTSEGAVAIIRMSPRDGNLVQGQAYEHEVGSTLRLPMLEMTTEDYRRLARLARTGPAPVLEINSNVRFDDSDSMAYNIIADIPGTDRNAGYVMAGAHFDSWAAGDGAVDNGAGSVVVMEAARIIASLGIRPRRTIRFALWAAEEQGLLGSRAYTERHIATRPAPRTGNNFTDRFGWFTTYPVTLLPGQADLKVYFNMDNGSGRFRGIYAEGNVAAVPMLQQWIQPFASLGAAHIVAGPTRGTDHEFFSASGIPAFQFIQDPLDYRSRLHHTNIDTVDHIQAEDLRQAAVVMAGMLVTAANADETLPRMPVPQQPVVTDPFAYEYPDE